MISDDVREEATRFALGVLRTHEPESEGSKTDTSALPLRTITADRLVLAAGSLGSPYLLLKSFPGLSKALGSRWCGNGDLLGFLTRAPTPLDPDFGPVITSRIRYEGDAGRGFYIEDGGYPTFVSWMLEASQVSGNVSRAVRFLYRLLRNRLTASPVSNVSAELAQLLGECKTSSGTLPLLGMGRDVPDGNLSLRDGYLQCDWTIKTSRRYYESVKRSMQDLGDVLGARFESQPLWYFRRVVTVHPVGGCPLGRNADEGVVDPYGQVFGYPGLSVADGSVMPGPVGPNPSLTIAALADRFAEWTILNWRPR